MSSLLWKHENFASPTPFPPPSGRAFVSDCKSKEGLSAKKLS